MADCAYTFTGPDGKPLTIVGVPGLKAYLVDGGLEHLFPERKFPLKAVARFSREGIGATINVDGVERPTTNNTGQLIHQTEDGIRNFWRWFSGSKVVDSEGRPLVVYHGTTAESKTGADYERPLRDEAAAFQPIDTFDVWSDIEFGGHFGTLEHATKFSGSFGEIYPAYLKAEGLLEGMVDHGGFSVADVADFAYEKGLITKGSKDRIDQAVAEDDWYVASIRTKNALRDAGVDGLKYLNRGDAISEEEEREFERSGKSYIDFSHTATDAEFKAAFPSARYSYAIFDNFNIKSAIGNQGSFSPEESDIHYSTTEKPTRKNTFQNQAAAEEHLLQSFGPGIKNLISSKVLNFTQGKASWPEKVQRQLRGGEEAVYVNGKAYIDLQAIGKDRLNAVVLHEIGEHFNLKLMLGPEGYKSLQDQITNRAKIKGSQAEKIWNQVERLYPDLEVGSEAFVSEVIAKLGEANPQAPWYRRLLTRIKAFLVERGLGRGFITGTMTEDDMHDLLRTSLMSAAGRFAQGEARVYGEGVMASVPRPEILTLLEEFTEDDEIFKHPVSGKTTIDDIMSEVAPIYVFDSRLSEMASLNGAKNGIKSSVFVTPRKRLIFINESKGKVWLNVSKMKPGDAGGAIYAAVGNYAYNNGLKFVDDPAGLSAASVKRRPVHMLSLALKFGTTDFLGVSENFDALSRQIGLPELNWKNDYDSDLASLIFRNAFYVYEALPELHRINYDFKTDRFRDDTGAVLPEVWARRLSRRDAARSNSIGDSTIRRAVFLKSLASATGEEKSRLLENYRANGGLAGRVSLKGIFSRPIENLQPAPEERSSLWNRWFGKSKMQRGGEPIKFYHGSQAEFTVFDKSRLATNTAHSTAGLGHFFTEDKGEASRYGGNVKEVFLSVQKPYIVNSWDLDTKFNDAEGAAKFREKLQAEGYDGIYIRDAKYAVTFESNQAKLTENQSPTFGEDVRFSRVEDGKGAEAFEKARYAEDTSWLKQTRQYLLKAADTLQKSSLALLGTNHIVEIVAPSAPGMADFYTLTQERGAKVSEVRMAADRLIAIADKLKKPVRQVFNRIVNESTDQDTNVVRAWAGVHKVEGSGVPMFEVFTQDKLSLTSQSMANIYLKEMGMPEMERNRVVFNSREKAEAFNTKLREIIQRQDANTTNAKLTEDNVARRQVHAQLHAQMSELPQEAKDLYVKMGDMFEKVAREKLDEIVRRIEDGITNKKVRQEMIAHMRKSFEDNSLQWYYAPLTRFGKFWYYGKIKDQATGKMVEYREHFETQDALDTRLAMFKDAGGRVEAQGMMLEQGIENLISIGAGDTYTAEIQKIIYDQMPDGPARDTLLDAVYQHHLSMLPEVSIRHASQHRKGVKGAETDVMRSFASRMHHSASQLANMVYGEKLSTVLDDHREMKRLWENPRFLDAEADKIEALNSLKADWDALAKPGEIEVRLLNEDADEAVLTQAKSVRDELGGTYREAFTTDGQSKGFVGLTADSAEEELDRLLARTKRIYEGAKRVKPEDRKLVGNVVDELQLTFNAMMNTQSSSVDQLAMQISNLNFFGMLGFGVSSVAMNALQVPNVVTPVLYAKFGAAKSVKALGGAYKDFMKAVSAGATDADGNYSMTEVIKSRLSAANGKNIFADKELTREYRRNEALEIRKADGTISRTQQFDLIGVAEGGMEKAGAIHKVAKFSGWGFHHAERLNREVTLDAAFTLRYDEIIDGPAIYHVNEAGNPTQPYSAAEMEDYAFETALAYAAWVNDRTNLNYSSEVAARIFRGPIARIAFQFKKYQQGMLYLYGKAFHDMMKGIKRENFPDGPQGAKAFEEAQLAKTEARRTFMALLFIQTSFAGALSIPLMGSLMAVYEMLAGDDDEEKDLREDLLKGLTPLVGAKQALAFTNGFWDAYTPIPLSSRLNLGDLFFREPMVDDSKAAGAAYAAQFLGPTGGSFINATTALDLFSKGEFERGFERLLPKAAGDVLKGVRFFFEGATNIKGYHEKDMSAFESFVAGIGFGNSELNRHRLEMRFAKGDEAAITKARQDITYDLGWQLTKGEDLDQDRIDEWNDRHPEYPITLENIIRSSKNIGRTIETREEHGFTLNRKLDYLYEESDIFDEDE